MCVRVQLFGEFIQQLHTVGPELYHVKVVFAAEIKCICFLILVLRCPTLINFFLFVIAIKFICK